MTGQLGLSKSTSTWRHFVKILKGCVSKCLWNIFRKDGIGLWELLILRKHRKGYQLGSGMKFFLVPRNQGKG